MATVARIVSLSWIVNFVFYAVIAIWLGGDAFNGYEEGGRYFLSYHGKTTEVARAVFMYSLWHTYLLIAHIAIAFPLGILAWRSSNKRSSRAV